MNCSVESFWGHVDERRYHVEPIVVGESGVSEIGLLIGTLQAVGRDLAKSQGIQLDGTNKHNFLLRTTREKQPDFVVSVDMRETPSLFIRDKKLQKLDAPLGKIQVVCHGDDKIGFYAMCGIGPYSSVRNPRIISHIMDSLQSLSNSTWVHVELGSLGTGLSSGGEGWTPLASTDISLKDLIAKERGEEVKEGDQYFPYIQTLREIMGPQLVMVKKGDLLEVRFGQINPRKAAFKPPQEDAVDRKRSVVTSIDGKTRLVFRQDGKKPLYLQKAEVDLDGAWGCFHFDLPNWPIMFSIARGGEEDSVVLCMCAKEGNLSFYSPINLFKDIRKIERIDGVPTLVRQTDGEVTQQTSLKTGESVVERPVGEEGCQTVLEYTNLDGRKLRIVIEHSGNDKKPFRLDIEGVPEDFNPRTLLSKILFSPSRIHQIVQITEGYCPLLGKD